MTIESLSSLNDEVIRFSKLVDNINVLKTFEERSLEAKFEDVNLVDIISKVCEEFDILARQNNIEIIIESNFEEEYFIKGDRDKIKQVFINLISNAIKFTEVKFKSGGGKVEVKIFKENQKTIVEVGDNGIGISEDDIDFIFESMYRGDKSRNIIEGSGIGLTVVKDILLLHSASIEVKSQEGEGSSFKIVF